MRHLDATCYLVALAERLWPISTAAGMQEPSAARLDVEESTAPVRI